MTERGVLLIDPKALSASSNEHIPAPGARQLRRSLFQKYFAALFVAVVGPLLANGGSEAWFGYHDQRMLLGQRLRAEEIGRAHV